MRTTLPLVFAATALILSACSDSGSAAGPTSEQPDAALGDAGTGDTDGTSSDALPEAAPDDGDAGDAPEEAHPESDAADAAAEEAAAEPDGAIAAIAVELPPGFNWCGSADCGLTPVELRVCGAPGCQPSRSASVDWTINGEPFDRLALLVSPSPDGCATTVDSGPASMWYGYALVAGSAGVTLQSDACDATVTHYQLALPWEGALHVTYEATGFQSTAGSSWFFRFTGYDPLVDPSALHGELAGIAAAQAQLLALTAIPFSAWMMPTELALPLGAEGNLSLGGGQVTINYGNPDWIAAVGGARGVILHEFSHEYTHELFQGVAASYQGNTTCLNEGMADAVGNHLGYVPDSDFCPDSGSGCVYVDGCAGITEVHAAGNCVLWNIRNAGMLGADTLRNLFHPARTYLFDSCDFLASQTGNSYVVLFSEASGQDAAATVTAMGLPNAGSYAAAKAALGW